MQLIKSSSLRIVATFLLLAAQHQAEGGTAETKQKKQPEKSEIFQVVKYGPSDCISTYPSDKGTCILMTDCAEGSLENIQLGLVCADQRGEMVRHVFGVESFEHKEIFDTLIPCTQCLSLDNFDSGKDTEETVLKDEVETLKHDFNALNARVTTLEEANKAEEKAEERAEEKVTEKAEAQEPNAEEQKAFLSAQRHHHGRVPHKKHHRQTTRRSRTEAEEEEEQDEDEKGEKESEQTTDDEEEQEEEAAEDEEDKEQEKDDKIDPDRL